MWAVLLFALSLEKRVCGQCVQNVPHCQIKTMDLNIWSVLTGRSRNRNGNQNVFVFFLRFFFINVLMFSWSFRYDNLIITWPHHLLSEMTVYLYKSLSPSNHQPESALFLLLSSMITLLSVRCLHIIVIRLGWVSRRYLQMNTQTTLMPRKQSCHLINH